MTTRTYSVPGIFYDDHRSRDLPETGTSREIARKGRSVVVEMDEAAFADLYSDADYYSDPGVAADMGLRNLARSAGATLGALAAQNASLVAILRAK